MGLQSGPAGFAMMLCLVATPMLTAADAAEPVTVSDAKLIPYVVRDGAIPKSLTGAAGNPAEGAKIAIDRSLGNCMSCHAVGLPNEPFPGNLGPDLAGIGSRSTAGELRLRLVDPKRLNAGTSMPAFYKVDGLNRVAAQYIGKSILTAAQIEDVIAYLMTLKN